jgi:hypothetical protein
LVSAPQFKGVEGFDDGENGLFEIRVGVDERGVIWGFLGGDGDGEKMKEMEGIRKGVKAGCVWVGGSVLEDGWFNWKVGCEFVPLLLLHLSGTQETLTPQAVNKSRLETSLGLNQQQQTPSYVQRLLRSISFQQQQHQQPESTHLFPSTFLFTIPRSQCWLSIRFLPATENKSAVRYDVYSYRDAKDAAAQSLLKDVEENVKGLIEDLEAEYQGVAEEYVHLGTFHLRNR